MIFKNVACPENSIREKPHGVGVPCRSDYEGCRSYFHVGVVGAVEWGRAGRGREVRGARSWLVFLVEFQESHGAFQVAWSIKVVHYHFAGRFRLFSLSSSAEEF